MSQNPYATPAASLSTSPAAPVRLYSPVQVAAGVFLGGPVGAVYFLRANFLALKDDERAQAALLYGLLFVIAAISLAFVLPKNFPSMPLNIAYMFGARQIAETKQLSKQAIEDSAEYDFQSNWRVVGLSLLCLLGSVLVAMAAYWPMHALGVA